MKRLRHTSYITLNTTILLLVVTYKRPRQIMIVSGRLSLQINKTIYCMSWGKRGII